MLFLAVACLDWAFQFLNLLCFGCSGACVLATSGDSGSDAAVPPGHGTTRYQKHRALTVILAVLNGSQVLLRICRAGAQPSSTPSASCRPTLRAGYNSAQQGWTTPLGPRALRPRVTGALGSAWPRWSAPVRLRRYGSTRLPREALRGLFCGLPPFTGSCCALLLPALSPGWSRQPGAAGGRPRPQPLRSAPARLAHSSSAEGRPVAAGRPAAGPLGQPCRQDH